MKLLEYQDETVAFAQARNRSIIAHEPGLGKTAIGIMAASLPALVICPAGVKIHWEDQVATWRPLASELKQFTIMSYSDRRLGDVDPCDFRTLIVDEAHYLKSHEAIRSLVVCKLIRRVGKAGRVMALSGTPVPNRPIELWPLLYAMQVTTLKYEDFASRYTGAYWDRWGKLDVRGATNLPELRELLASYCIRYTKAQVMPQLPPKTWKVVALDLPIGQQEKAFSLDAIKAQNPGVAFEAMSEVLQLHGVRKVPAALEHVENALRGSDDSAGKIVVFAHHREVIASLAEGLKSYHPVTVTGSDTLKRREQAKRTFIEVPECRVFIGQSTAAGTGVDGLQGVASHMIMVEGDWVPGNLEQRADRLHRIGAKNPILIEILTVSGSIDEYMIRRALQKARVVAQVVPVTERARVTQGSSGTEPRHLPDRRGHVHHEPPGQGDPRMTTAAATAFAEAFKAIREGFDQLEGAIGAASAKGKAPAKSKGTGKKKDDEPKGPTKEDVIKALQGLITSQGAHGNDAVEIVLKAHGRNLVSELDEDQFADIIKAAQEYEKPAETGGFDLTA